jgi:uncharacterized protein YgiM (DUF1202 family)
MIKHLLIFLFVSTLVLKVSAQEAVDGETKYVTDILRLSLYETANQKSKRLQYLASGERLEVTKKWGAYAFVTTESGGKGWVKKAFLVSTLPTILLLEKEKEKNQALVRDLDKLANSSQVINQYETDMDAMSEKLNAMTEAKKALQADLDELKIRDKEQQRKLNLVTEAPQHEAQPLNVLIMIAQGYWRYLLPLCFGFMLVGYILAGRLLKARIKKKFQGIKVW